MTYQQPGTTRVGGGASARLAAIVAALILVAVAGLAIIGRPPVDPTPSPSPPAAAAATATARASVTPTVLATPSPTPRRATASPTPLKQPRPRPGAFTDLAVVVSLGRLSQVTFLQEDHKGALHATSRLATSRPAPAGTLGLVELREGGEVLEWRDIASFRLPLDPHVPKSPETALVLERHVAAHAELEDAPLLVRSGYSLIVYAEGRRSGIVLHITIEPGAHDGVGVGREPMRQLGDDGLIGHPGSPGPVGPTR